NSVTIVEGEITEEDKVRKAVAGVSVVYHLVGRLYHPSVPTELYRETHVKGTEIILRACQDQSQLTRFVHCSTTGVHGVTGRRPAAEDAPFGPTNPYEETKLEGELLALKAHKEHGLPVSVIRPGLVYGPGDLHLLSFFSTIKKGIPPLIDGGKALIHPVYIDDMTDAFLLSAEKKAAIGHSYNIAGNFPVTFKDLSRAIAHSLGKELPGVSIPLWVANTASDVFSVIPGIQGEDAPLTRSRVKFLTNSRLYSIERARHELGYEPKVTLEDGMKLTAAWYHQHGYL
ncbi:MAG TPA: NAD-dependent epimerase/dehydratase family protein, partial [Ktedonobacteraceae bacterium]